MLVGRDGLRNAVGTLDGQLHAVDSGDFAGNEFFAHAFPHALFELSAARGTSRDNFGGPAIGAGWLSAHENLVAYFEVGEFGVLTFFAEFGLAAEVDLRNLALTRFSR